MLEASKAFDGVNLLVLFKKLFIYLYHTHINIWYTCNKTGKTQNTIRILKRII